MVTYEVQYLIVYFQKFFQNSFYTSRNNQSFDRKAANITINKEQSKKMCNFACHIFFCFKFPGTSRECFVVLNTVLFFYKKYFMNLEEGNTKKSRCQLLNFCIGLLSVHPHSPKVHCSRYRNQISAYDKIERESFDSYKLSIFLIQVCRLCSVQKPLYNFLNST